VLVKLDGAGEGTKFSNISSCNFWVQLMVDTINDSYCNVFKNLLFILKKFTFRFKIKIDHKSSLTKYLYFVVKNIKTFLKIQK
jgi:hypothetical protein